MKMTNAEVIELDYDSGAQSGLNESYSPLEESKEPQSPRPLAQEESLVKEEPGAFQKSKKSLDSD